GSFWQLAKYPIYRVFVPLFDGYLIVGENARRYLLHYGAPPQRMFSSPHAIDNDFFSDSVDSLRRQRDSLRQDWRVPEDATVFLFAGKFLENKRPWDFARAIAGAASRQRRIWGLMVGDGPEREQVEAQAVSEGWPIRFAGFLNQTEM